MQYIPELQRRWLKERLLTFAKCHGLGMLRHMKGEFSSHDQGKPPTAYSVQCTQGLYNSNHDDDGVYPKYDNFLSCPTDLSSPSA